MRLLFRIGNPRNCYEPPASEPYARPQQTNLWLFSSSCGWPKQGRLQHEPPRAAHTAVNLCCSTSVKLVITRTRAPTTSPSSTTYSAIAAPCSSAQKHFSRFHTSTTSVLPVHCFTARPIVPTAAERPSEAYFELFLEPLRY